MIYHPKTRIRESYEWPVNPAASTLFEGQVLINSLSAAVNTSYNNGGIGSVTQSNGNGSDVWAGVALNVWQTPTTAKFVDVITVPSTAPYTAVLTNAPISPSSTTISAVLQGGTGALTYNGGVGSGQFAVTANTTITFNAAQAGIVYNVVYSYTLSTQQAISFFGDGSVLKRSPSAITNSVGVIRGGLVYTDQFDASQNWYAAAINNISTGAGGVFTQGGSGVILTWVTVFEAPSQGFPYLGLMINT